MSYKNWNKESQHLKNIVMKIKSRLIKLESKTKANMIEIVSYSVIPIDSNRKNKSNNGYIITKVKENEK